jgi:hypothetical protein
MGPWATYERLRSDIGWTFKRRNLGAHPESLSHSATWNAILCMCKMISRIVSRAAYAVVEVLPLDLLHSDVLISRHCSINTRCYATTAQ